MREDGGDSENRILSNICVPVLQAKSCGREQRLNEFRLPEFAEEAKSVAPDVLIGVLQVVKDAIAFRKQS